MSLVKNAAPGVIHLGTDDKSKRLVTPERDPIPQHCPKVFIMGRKGSTEAMLLGGAKLIPSYGEESFDQDNDYFNHQTRFLQAIAGQGNTCVVQRIVPEDAGVRSNIVLYMDVLDTMVPNYVRNSLGDYVIDPNTNAYKVDENKPEILGKKIKYITEYRTGSVEQDLGMYISKQGTMSKQADNDDVKLVFNADETANLSNGMVITGKTSNAVGNIKSVTLDNGKTSIILGGVTGTFEVAEEVNNGSADIATVVESIDTELKDKVYSTMFPILEFKAKNQGEYYNNIGFTIEALYGENSNEAIIEEVKTIPYKLGLYSRSNPGATPEVLRSLYAEPSVEMVLKAKAKNPLTESRNDIEAVFESQWFNETDSLKTLRYNDYEGMHFYRGNYEKILKEVIATEKEYISDAPQTWEDGKDEATRMWFDYTTSDEEDILEEAYLLELFNCKSSKNKNYFTVMIEKEAGELTGVQKEVSISKHAPVFLNGGSDGTMSNENYETVVSKLLAQYADNDSEVMDTAINVESTIYDSGFTLDTKKDLLNFIALRKDTNVILSTHDASLGEKDLPLSQVRAIAVALKARAKLAPESEYFGTPVMRALVVGGTGLLRDGSSLDRIPLTYEIAIKSAKMFGAGNYEWKAEEAFDHGANAVLTELVDVSPAFVPNGIKATLWNDGLVWAQPKDRVDYFFPAIQTIYDNDTSVLNAYPNMVVVCTVTKIADDAWREFSGTTFLTDGEFIEAVESYMNNRLNGIFAGLVKVVPEVVIDSIDEQRGYTWHLVNKIYANNMKTKMIYATEAYRASDLAS